MQQAFAVLEDPHAAREQGVEVSVGGVLHDRQIRRSGGRHHYADVDATLDRLSEGIDRFGVRQEIRVLDADALARDGQAKMVQDLHRGRRAFGFEAGDVDFDAADTLELGKGVPADEQLTGTLGPVLAEHGLHRMHGGTAKPHAEIAHVLAVLRVAEPLVDDAMAAHQGDAAVEHDELAMVAVVENADVAPVPRMVQLELAARGFEPLLDVAASLLAAFAIHQHAHDHAGAAARDQCVDETPAQHAVLPQIGFEVYRSRRRLDFLEQDVEEVAVLEEFDGVARVDCAVGKA